MSDDVVPRRPEIDPRWNQEPGIAVIPGSNLQREYAKFEQFPWSKWAAGSPGNPYVKREFPKMLYRAEHFNGVIACMAAPPDSHGFKDPQDYDRAVESARRFTEKCQTIVHNEDEMQRAMENGWRESAKEAVDYLEARDRARATETAHRLHDDKNMSELAKREIAAASAAVGGEHLPEIPEQPKKRRGRPPKNAAA